MLLMVHRFLSKTHLTDSILVKIIGEGMDNLTNAPYFPFFLFSFQCSISV